MSLWVALLPDKLSDQDDTLHGGWNHDYDLDDAGFAGSTLNLMDDAHLPDLVVCQLWPHHSRAFKTTRKYAAWYGHCSKCGAKVVVTNVIHKRMKSETITLICEQCDELDV